MARRLGLDVLKGAAIILVVFNHTLLWPMRSGDLVSAFLYGTAFGTVAAFSAAAGYVQGLHPPREERAVVRKRAGQLLVPWLIWAPLYALAPLVWEAVGGGALPMEFDPGPWAREILLGNGTFWAVSPLYIAAFWFGLRIARDGAPKTSHGVLAAIVALSMALGGVVTLVRVLHPEARWLMWLPYAIGAIGGCTALGIAAGGRIVPGPTLAWVGERLARVGRASLGLYIVHPLLVAPFELVARGRGGAAIAVLATAAVFVVGTPVVERVRAVPYLRRAV